MPTEYEEAQSTKRKDVEEEASSSKRRRHNTNPGPDDHLAINSLDGGWSLSSGNQLGGTDCVMSVDKSSISLKYRNFESIFKGSEEHHRCSLYRLHSNAYVENTVTLIVEKINIPGKSNHIGTK